MAPCLRPGTWIGVQWLGRGEADAPRPGELVLCRGSDGRWILHRALGPEPGASGRWLVKGDASFLGDTFSVGEIWGRAAFIRSAEGERPVPVRTGSLDRWIAWLSGCTLRQSGNRSRLLRKLTQTLGWIGRLR